MGRRNSQSWMHERHSNVWRRLVFRPEEEQNAHKITCGLKRRKGNRVCGRVGQIFERKEREGENNQFRHGWMEVRGLRVESSKNWKA